MPEWSNGAVSKTVDLARGPRVRIPISPQPMTSTRRKVGFLMTVFDNQKLVYDFQIRSLKFIAKRVLQ